MTDEPDGIESASPEETWEPTPGTPPGSDEALAEAAEKAAREGGLDSQEVLRLRMAELQGLADEYLDGWQRARAEFANYRTRIKRDEQEIYSQAAAAILAKVLPVVDDLERALNERPGDGDVSAWADGIELIYRKLRGILEAEGVENIPAEGQPFDPNLHEALSHEASPDHGEGQVIAVVRTGYRMGPRILRPALVRVAK